MEDRNFRGNICQCLKEHFHLSDILAWKYTCVLFLLHGRYEVHPSNKRTSFLTWNDLEFFSSVIMQNWLQEEYVLDATNPETSDLLMHTIYESTDDYWETDLQRKMERAAIDVSANADGIALDTGMTGRLRDIKTYMINDVAAMNNFVSAVLESISPSFPGSSSELSVQIKATARGLFAIGERLSQPQELKGFFEDLIDLVGRPLKAIVSSPEQLDIVFDAIALSLQLVPSWYLVHERKSKAYVADWSRFVEVCRTCVQRLFGRL